MDSINGRVAALKRKEPNPRAVSGDVKRGKYEDSDAAMRLRLSPTEEHVYTEFNLEVHLEYLRDKKEVTPPGGFSLEAKLHGGEGEYDGLGATSNALEIVGQPTKIIPGGSSNLTLRVREDKFELYQNRQFIVVVGLVGHPEIPGVRSMPIKFMKYKLYITVMSGTEENGLWYKDQGGRDKAITLNVEARYKDGDGNEKPWVPPDSIPLECKLMYNNGTEVSNKSLLRISPECSRAISPDDGKGDIKFRIEDVSKNHQKMLFCVHVSPDYKMKNGAFTNIAPVTSQPVNVKSKVSKRPKQAGTKMEHAVGVSGLSANNSVYNPIAPSPDNYMGSSQVPHPPVRQHTNSDTESLYSVIEWAGTVVKAVESVEWSLCGYETGEDGEVDKSKPMFRCPACMANKNSSEDSKHKADCCIAKIMIDYSDTVFHSLETLLKAFDGGGSSSTNGDGSHD